MRKDSDNKRIHKLIEIIMQVARGNYNCEAEISDKNDEFDSLAIGINMMIDDLRHNTLIEAQNKRIIEINEQLIVAKERAEESDRLKSAFLANVSHEIRTPMNGILGFAELLKEPELSETVKAEFIDIIETSGHRLLSIINDLIDVSKIESGQVELYLSEMNINQQLKSIYKFFKPLAENKGLHLELNLPLADEDTFIESDPDKFYAILVNLVNNAIKYTHKGFIEFGYKKNSTYFYFYVKDSGIGIREDRQEAIFNRFIQADITIARTFEGTGLGLSIAKSYIEMLGGKIRVESKPGAGSVFSFTHPC